MSNFNDENEKVRDTVGRVMTDMGYFNNPVTINTPIGSRTFYENNDAPMMPKTRQAQQSSQYYIRDDKNYAWDMPQKYDHRDNIWGTINNFKVINQKHPIAKPITTGSTIGDINMNVRLGKINPIIPLSINAYNAGYMGAGYLDNWQQAKKVGKLKEYNDL